MSRRTADSSACFATKNGLLNTLVRFASRNMREQHAHANLEPE
jgi:hypothetical protein